MLFELKNNRIPIKSWCQKIEDEALLQAENLANHPTTFRHVALMPDCHSGYGMPIGGVIACENAVIPNAVGVDIGCGMCAVQTDFRAESLTLKSIQKMLDTLKRTIPVGFTHHKHDQKWRGFDEVPSLPVVSREIKSAGKQLGTLGGGNHFIEIQKGSDGNVWLMLHSGSRNFGYKIAREYNEQAKALCRKRKDISSLYRGGDGLAFLPDDSRLYEEYVSAMDFALAFALENRRQMMTKFKNCAMDTMHCTFIQEINIHHNFAAREKHFGRNVMVHRKGATRAGEGQLGIIPGSMGTPSYIVRGIGNPESFCSCSHGAGRVMGRKAFNRSHSVEECSRAMEGIVFDKWKRKKKKEKLDLSEAPQAYKDIDKVIEAQQDLVEVVVKLEPMGVMKG